MFERFTEKAKRVIFFARYEAGQLGSPYIETEHLLLGILREDKVAHNLLRSPSSAELIRRQIEQRTISAKRVPASVDLPLSNEGKRVLAYAAEEAEHLSDTHIGTEHLLLGLLREKSCFAAQLLNSEGVFLDGARERIAEKIEL
jgi:ATP-dependent Clp protease ATP-binding subunit ClpC